MKNTINTPEASLHVDNHERKQGQYGLGRDCRKLNLGSILGICLNLLAGGLLVCSLPASLHAQTVSFAGVQSTSVSTGTEAPWGVAVDGAGDLFVAVSAHNQVVKFPAAGGAPISVGSGLSDPRGVAVDAKGDVFIADTGHNRIVELPAGGGAQNLIFPNTRLNAPAGVAVDAAGKLYVADTGNNRVLAGPVTVTAGFYLYYSATVATGLQGPQSVAVNASGDVLIADSGGNRVVEVPWNATLARYGAPAVVGSGLLNPYGVAVDAAGNIYVADTDHNRIVMVPAGGGAQVSMGSGLNLPSAVAVDGKGGVYVADLFNGRVVKIQAYFVNFGSANICPAGLASPAPCGQTVTLNYQVNASTSLGAIKVLTQGSPNLDFTLASASTCTGSVSEGESCTVNVTFTPMFAGMRPGAVQITSASGAVLATTLIYGTGVGPQVAFGPAAQIAFPVTPGLAANLSGVAVDGAGDIFVGDTMGKRVIELFPGGAQQTTGFDGQWPRGIAVDGAGDLFVVESVANLVVRLPAVGGAQTTVVSGLNDPFGVAVDGAGDVFVADSGNNRVVEAPAGGGPDVVVASGLKNPESVSVDSNGNLFIADTGNGRIMKAPAGGGPLVEIAGGLAEPESVQVDSAGDLFIAEAGSEQVVEWSAGEMNQVPLPSGVEFSMGMALDAAGNLFVVNSGNNSVLEFNRSQAPALAFAPTPFNAVSDGLQTVTVQNIGNAQLDFSIPRTGSNPSIATGFALDGGSTCPELNGGSFEAGTLAIGAACTYSIGFTPNTVGSFSGSLVVTDNALNGNSAMQTIQLSGVAEKSNQSIAFTGLPATATWGSAGPYSLIASATSGLAVTFTVTGPATLNGSKLTITGPGVVTVTASQAGNGDYNAAAPVALTIDVAQASQTIMFTGLPATATYGSLGPYTLNATASSGLPVSYTVTGPATLAGSTLTITAAGTVTVTATQAGNVDYAAATPVPLSIAVAKAPQTISFTGLPATATYGSAGPYTLNATTTSGLAVSYSVTGPGTISGSILTITGAGSVTVTASQAGNSGYTPATSVSLTIAVGQASQTISFTGIPATGAFGSVGPYTLNGTATSGLPVSYTVTGPATLNGAKLTITGVGTVTVTASQTGNANYSAATNVTQAIVVSKGNQTIAFTLPFSGYFGQAGPYTLNATASSGLPVSYTLVSGPASLSGSTLTITGTGVVVIQASQAGNTNYNAATPVTDNILIFPGSQTITFTGLPASATFGSAGPYALNATSSSGLAVIYTITGPATLSGSKLTITGPGTVTVTASQPGNTNYNAATPVTQTIKVVAG